MTQGCTDYSVFRYLVVMDICDYCWRPHWHRPSFKLICWPLLNHRFITQSHKRQNKPANLMFDISASRINGGINRLQKYFQISFYWLIISALPHSYLVLHMSTMTYWHSDSTWKVCVCLYLCVESITELSRKSLRVFVLYFCFLLSFSYSRSDDV